MKIIHIDSAILDARREDETPHACIKNALSRSPNALHVHLNPSETVYEIVVDDGTTIPESLNAEEVEDFVFIPEKIQQHLHDDEDL